MSPGQTVRFSVKQQRDLITAFCDVWKSERLSCWGHIFSFTPSGFSFSLVGCLIDWCGHIRGQRGFVDGRLLWMRIQTVFSLSLNWCNDGVNLLHPAPIMILLLPCRHPVIHGGGDSRRSVSGEDLLRINATDLHPSDINLSFLSFREAFPVKRFVSIVYQQPIKPTIRGLTCSIEN